MRALVYTNPGEVQLRDEPDPEPAPGEELLTVRASGICGSELHGFRTPGMRVPPLIMGHEFVGTTAGGRRVAVNPLLSCGECDSCAAGRPQVCRSRALLGVHRAGGFAERVAVPQSALHDLPEVVPDAAAALVEPLANAVHACSLLPADAARVAVLGAGPIGLLCAQVASRRGAAVQISDPSEPRCATARRLGLDAVAAADGEFDAVIDAVGLPATRQTSLERVRPAGTAVWIGLATSQVEIDGNALVRGEKAVRGSFAYTPAEFAEAVALAADLDLSWTTAVPLADSARVFYSLADGNTEIVKAVLVPDGA
ncbi:MAG TPA: alcohol dehydrogenase catalytic domain-containing protein [Jatrophihabitans sp.]|nr:alcohol dehydrogenase catalytic domain-containing protein [Jatrophihabitans sp.]